MHERSCVETCQDVPCSECLSAMEFGACTTLAERGRGRGGVLWCGWYWSGSHISQQCPRQCSGPEAGPSADPGRRRRWRGAPHLQVAVLLGEEHVERDVEEDDADGAEAGGAQEAPDERQRRRDGERQEDEVDGRVEAVSHLQQKRRAVRRAPP